MEDEFTTDKRQLKADMIKFFAKYHLKTFEANAESIRISDASYNPLDEEYGALRIEFKIEL